MKWSMVGWFQAVGLEARMAGFYPDMYVWRAPGRVTEAENGKRQLDMRCIYHCAHSLAAHGVHHESPSRPSNIRRKLSKTT